MTRSRSRIGRLVGKPEDVARPDAGVALDEAAAIEQQLQPLLGREPQVMAAARADEEPALELLPIDELRRSLAARPERGGGRRRRQPTPRDATAAVTSAPSARPSARLLQEAARRRQATPCPDAPRRGASTALPTTTASANRATFAACSGPVMPKPTPTGRPTRARTRLDHASPPRRRSGAAAPVVPVIET